MDIIRLNNNVQMPLLGLGVFQITDQAACKESVRTALETGYRLIGTAACYGNERAVGEAVKESDNPRKEVFLTSKVSIQDAGYDKTMRSFEKTLENLQTDRGHSLILDVSSFNEVYRLHNIRFAQ